MKPKGKSPEPRLKAGDCSHIHSSQKPRLLADRTDTVGDLSPIRDGDFIHDEKAEPLAEHETLQLSESMAKDWSQADTTTLDKTALPNKYPVPETDTTRVPKLDEIFTSSESKFHRYVEAKAVEKDLLHISACQLDIACPLLALVKNVQGKGVTPKEVLTYTKDALTLLGNSVANTSKICKRRILKVCNLDITSLAEDQD